MSPFLISIYLVVAGQPQTVTVEDFLRKECAAGKQESCARAEQLAVDIEHQQRLEKRAEEFWQNVDTHALMLDQKKPDLAAAYPLVMQDYVRMETEAGNPQTLLEDRLSLCGRHYHNHWVNKKMWWPADDNGTPDWPSIYNFIVDHYYGFCVKQK